MNVLFELKICNWEDPTEKRFLPHFFDECIHSQHINLSVHLSSQSLPLLQYPPLVNCHTDWDRFRDIVTDQSQHTLAITSIPKLEGVRSFTTQRSAEHCTPTLVPCSSSLRLPLQCQALLRSRHLARKCWQRVRSDSAHREYRHYNNLVKKELKIARNECLATFFEKPYSISEH